MVQEGVYPKMAENRQFEITYSIYIPGKGKPPETINGKLSLYGDPADKTFILTQLARHVPVDWGTALNCNYAVTSIPHPHDISVDKWRSGAASAKKMRELKSSLESKSLELNSTRKLIAQQGEFNLIEIFISPDGPVTIESSALSGLNAIMAVNKIEESIRNGSTNLDSFIRILEQAGFSVQKEEN